MYSVHVNVDVPTISHTGLGADAHEIVEIQLNFNNFMCTVESKGTFK